MPITTPAMALNVAAGFAVWTSQLPTVAKIIVTLVLVGKFMLFFYSAWMADNERTRKIGIAICILLNTTLVVYSLFHSEYYIAVSAGVLLAALVVWFFAVVYDFSFKKRYDN